MSVGALPHLKETERLALSKFTSVVAGKLSGKLQKIVLYGSKARGDFHADSDIDVLVLVDGTIDSQTRDVISEASCETLLDYDVLLSTNTLNVDELEKLRQLGAKFVEHVESEGVELWVRH